MFKPTDEFLMRLISIPEYLQGRDVAYASDYTERIVAHVARLNADKNQKHWTIADARDPHVEETFGPLSNPVEQVV